MKDLKFGDTIQFGVWKFLETVNGVIKPQFACAQPISIGVRIGENHHTITEVGICGVNPPGISCVGASNSIDIHDCILINQVGAIYPDKEQWIVDGKYYENPPNFLNIEQIAPPITLPPVGYEWSTSIRMKNNSDSNVRIQRIFTPSNQNIIKSSFLGNTTVDESVLGRQAFCLSPNSDLLGCEGSIPTCTIGTLTSGGYYKIFVNDVEITESNRLFKEEEWARSLSKILKDDFNVVLVPLTLDLKISNDPYFNDVENGRFENRNNSYVKIRIVTIDASAIDKQFEPLNGSFQVTPRPDEGASFCLKKAEETHYLSSEINTDDPILAEDLSFISFEK